MVLTLQLTIVIGGLTSWGIMKANTCALCMYRISRSPSKLVLAAASSADPSPAMRGGMISSRAFLPRLRS